MIDLTPSTAALLMVWGTVVAVDLVSVPQALLSRPVVVGGVAGWILGDPIAGLRVGILFELFALDVLPIGAASYPDFGPATVAAVAVAAGMPWQLGLGVAVAIGLVVAGVGGWSLHLVRRRNARAVQRRAAALAAGESGAIRSLQYTSLGWDALRGAALTIFGLLLGWVVTHTVRLDTATVLALTLVAIGTGLAAVVGGALRGAGRGLRLKWLAAGVIVGSLVAAFA